MPNIYSFIVSVSPVINIASGSGWLYVEWNGQSATFRVLYRESGAPDYQVIVPRPSQLSHNISALQPNTLYNIVVEATYTLTQVKFNSSVTRVYTVPAGELGELIYTCSSTLGSYVRTGTSASTAVPCVQYARTRTCSTSVPTYIHCMGVDK